MYKNSGPEENTTMWGVTPGAPIGINRPEALIIAAGMSAELEKINRDLSTAANPEEYLAIIMPLAEDAEEKLNKRLSDHGSYLETAGYPVSQINVPFLDVTAIEATVTPEGNPIEGQLPNIAAAIIQANGIVTSVLKIEHSLDLGDNLTEVGD
jgi:hypothetical protein